MTVKEWAKRMAGSIPVTYELRDGVWWFSTDLGRTWKKSPLAT